MFTDSNGQKSTLVPAVDVYENADEILILADMPGAVGSAVEVTLEKDEIAISAPRKTAAGESPETGETYRRVFRVPKEIDPGGIVAELRQGVLELHLPKSAAAKPRVITVKTVN